MHRSVWLIVLLLVPVVWALPQDSLTLISANVTILDNEQAYAISCLPGAQTVEHTLTCLDTANSRSLLSVRLNESCYLVAIDTHGLGCNRLSVQAMYTRDGNLGKEVATFAVSKVQVSPQRTLESQQWDGGWGTASDTAYSVWILSMYPGRFDEQQSEGLLWLKEHRIEREKCWPLSDASRCSVYETAQTLAFLTLAGINDTNRIYSDAKAWLEEQQNYYPTGARWKLRVSPEEDAECRVEYNGGILYDDLINESEEKEWEIAPTYEALINVSCNDSEETLTVIDERGFNIFNHKYTEDEDYDYRIEDDEEGLGDLYRIPPACWSADRRWQYCNKKATLYALVSRITPDQKKLAKDWLHNQLHNASVGKYLSTDDTVFDTALYLYAVDAADREVLNWLVYSQNNDGSWDTGTPQQRVGATAMSIIALSNKSFDSSKEVLLDSRRWMSLAAPFDGWQNIKDDALTFMILKDNARPFLRVSDPLPLAINNSRNLVVTNPTSYNIGPVNVQVSGTLAQILQVQPGSIGPYGNMTLGMSLKADKAGSYVGVINVSNNRSTFLLIPAYFDENTRLEATVREEVHVFDGVGNLRLDVKSANSQFQCTISWDDDSIQTSAFKILKAGVATAPLRVQGNASGMYTGTMVCTHEEYSYVLPVSAEVQTHTGSPIAVSPSRLKVRSAGKNLTIKVSNALENEITITADFLEDQYYFRVVPHELVVGPLSHGEFQVVNQVLEGENVTQQGIVVLTALEQETQIPFKADIIYRVIPWKKYFIIAFVLALISALSYAGYYLYKHKESAGKEFEKDYLLIKKRLPQKIRKMLPKTSMEVSEDQKSMQEGKQERNYYQEIVAIMKSLDKSDEEISKRLTSEGLTSAQISQVLDAYEASLKVQQNIKHEEDVLGLLKTIGNESDDIFKKLRDKGFSEGQIKEALHELSKDVEDKEEQIKKKSGIEEN